jgi:hypothetical protein
LAKSGDHVGVVVLLCNIGPLLSLAAFRELIEAAEGCCGLGDMIFGTTPVGAGHMTPAESA